MSQPIPKKIIEKHNLEEEKPFYTLLVDGNSLLEVAFNADNRVNTRGEHIGGIFQFLLQLKILMGKRDFDYVYTFWDGNNSGQLRYDIYPEYKSNRDKNFTDDNVSSDYYKEIDRFIRRVLDKKNKGMDPEKVAKKERFHMQRKVIQEYLEELFVRQVMCDKIEGDDLIAYYCLHKKPNERIFIVSGDRDLTQLLDIDDYICMYIPVIKKFITSANHTHEFGYHQKNVLLKKMLCGDSSDAIKGIKGLGEKTLMELMPEIKEREVKLYEVIDRCNKLIEDRVNEKKKPLQVHLNIVNQISDGIHSGNVFEINKKIINLKEPLLSDDAKNMIDDMMYVPIDSDGRSMSNLYKMMIRDDIYELLDKDKFSNFLSTFNKTIDREKKFYEKWLEENK
jgi:5'-3' exonuclease